MEPFYFLERSRKFVVKNHLELRGQLSRYRKMQQAFDQYER